MLTTCAVKHPGRLMVDLLFFIASLELLYGVFYTPTVMNTLSALSTEIVPVFLTLVFCQGIQHRWSRELKR